MSWLCPALDLTLNIISDDIEEENGAGPGSEQEVGGSDSEPASSGPEEEHEAKKQKTGAREPNAQPLQRVAAVQPAQKQSTKRLPADALGSGASSGSEDESDDAEEEQPGAASASDSDEEGPSSLQASELERWGRMALHACQPRLPCA